MTLVDPADIDWAAIADGEVWLSAKSGIPAAISEATRRELLNHSDVDGRAATEDWPRVN